MKARLVGNYRGQDPKLHTEKTSSTAAIHSMFTVLELMVGDNRIQIRNVDHMHIWASA